MDPSVARTIWHRIEHVNAVAYFSPECRSAPEALGLVGFWMGYFACRAAPLGPVGPGVVEATFVNFHPARVRRAIPDAWERVAPADLVPARSAAAAAALRRLLPGGAADDLAPIVLPTLRAAIDAASPVGRPLFAANRDVPATGDPVADLWQAATTLREHRGDAHVALLTGAGLDGCEVLVLFAASAQVDGALFQRSRGWTEQEWDAAVDRLTSRGLLDAEGVLSSDGRALRSSIEDRTDALALEPYASLGGPAVAALVDALGSAARRIASSGDISYPNPMGLPAEG